MTNYHGHTRNNETTIGIYLYVTTSVVIYKYNCSGKIVEKSQVVVATQVNARSDL